MPAAHQSSVILQWFIHVHFYYCVWFFLLNICLYTFKAIYYFYPSDYLGMDLLLIFLYLFINLSRLTLASRGNKLTEIRPVLTSIVFLLLPLITLHAYYITLQTYVLRIDVVLNAFGLFLTCSELVLGCLTVLTFFYHSRRY